MQSCMFPNAPSETPKITRFSTFRFVSVNSSLVSSMEVMHGLFPGQMWARNRLIHRHGHGAFFVVMMCVSSVEKNSFLSLTFCEMTASI